MSLSAVKILLISGVALNLLFLVTFASAKTLAGPSPVEVVEVAQPEAESDESSPNNDNGSDGDVDSPEVDYNENLNVKLSAPRPASASAHANRLRSSRIGPESALLPTSRRQWKCAVKGERCGKVGGKWQSCCRSYTACVGNDPANMVCDH